MRAMGVAVLMVALLALASSLPTMAQDAPSAGGPRVSGALAAQLDREASPGWQPVFVAVGFIAVLAGCALALVRYRTGLLPGLNSDPTKAITIDAARRVGAIQILVVTTDGNRFLVVSGPSGVSTTRIEGSA